MGPTCPLGIAARARETYLAAHLKRHHGLNSTPGPILWQHCLLLGVELNDELLLHRDLDVLPQREPPHQTPFFRHEDFQPRRNRSATRVDVGHYSLPELARGPERHGVPDPHDVGRNRDFPAVHVDVAMAHHLPGLATGRGEAKPEYDVVEPTLQKLQEVFAGDPPLAFSPREILPELALEDPVDPLRFLLLSQLDAELRELHALEPMLSRREVAPLDPPLF